MKRQKTFDFLIEGPSPGSNYFPTKELCWKRRIFLLLSFQVAKKPICLSRKFVKKCEIQIG